MTLSTSTRNAEHYVWGGTCDGWHLLKRDDLSVIQERVPPGSAETRHVHTTARQFFFILEGNAILEIGDETVNLGPLEGVEVAPRVPHRFCNRSETDVVFLVISSPASHGDRQDLDS